MEGGVVRMEVEIVQCADFANAVRRLCFTAALLCRDVEGVEYWSRLVC